MQVKPLGFEDGIDSIGDAGGISVINDVIEAIELDSRQIVTGYNFAERNGTIQLGQTATIGFWAGKDGKDLIKSLNGDHKSTLLGDWLANEFPNLFGENAGKGNDLAGKNNDKVANHYKKLYDKKAKQVAHNNAEKLEVEVFALALATYTTNASLVSLEYDRRNSATINTSLLAEVESFGLLVTANGLGNESFNITTNGIALGVADGSVMQIHSILAAIDDRTFDGLIFDFDQNGKSDDGFERSLRILLNQMLVTINLAGNV